MRSMGTVQTGIHYYTTRQDDNHDANGERHLVDCRRIPSLRDFLPPLSVQTWMRAKRYDSQFDILDCLV